MSNELVTTDAIALITPKELTAQIALETEKRALLTQFISKQMKKGTDYGPIHINKNCENKYNCKNKWHFSKDVLFKPGAEKFCSLFKLRNEFVKDAETWEMLGSQAGTVAYICKLYTVNGNLVGEGRGAASVSEKGHPNTAIKIAEKRAKLDAVLSTGGLSDFFSQDEDIIAGQPEDMPVVDYDSPPFGSVTPNSASTREKTEKRYKDTIQDKTPRKSQLNVIASLAKRLGVEWKTKGELDKTILKLTEVDVKTADVASLDDAIAKLEILLQERK